MTGVFDTRILVEKIDPRSANVRVVWRELVAAFVPLQIKLAQKHLHNCIVKESRASILRALNIMIASKARARHFLAAIIVLDNITHWRQQTRFETDLAEHLKYDLEIPGSALALNTMLDSAIATNDSVLLRVALMLGADSNASNKHLPPLVECIVRKHYVLANWLILHPTTALECTRCLFDNNSDSSLSLRSPSG